jgi:hypothetical protein
MAFATIDKGSKYFNTVTYTGNGVGGTNITGVGFQPDLVWIKRRSATEYHVWNDAVRGVPKNLYSNVNNAEDTGNLMSAIISDGFTVQTDASVNGSGSTYVAWNWLGANTTVSNTSGTITSTVSANTTSGFSIVSYTGNGSSSATVGHGLGVTPAMIILKARAGTNAANNWFIYHKNLSANTNINFNTFGERGTGTFSSGIINTSPTSSTFGFTVGSTVINVNESGTTFVAYCFADVKGYSKFGSYTGNGNTSGNGTFIYLGFKPKFIMIKRSDTAGFGWYMRDTARDTYNVGQNYLDASSSGAEGSGTPAYLDYLSNGFKLTNTSASDGINASGGTYIYMAFAENPFVSSKGIPCTAR